MVFFLAAELHVYRVVTDYRDHRGNRILDHGPWFASENAAESWAVLLRSVGYCVRIERLEGLVAAHRHAR